MFCTNCGRELNDRAVLCPGCGCAVESPAAGAPSPKRSALKPIPRWRQTVGSLLLVIGLITVAVNWSYAYWPERYVAESREWLASEGNRGELNHDEWTSSGRLSDALLKAWSQRDFALANDYARTLHQKINRNERWAIRDNRNSLFGFLALALCAALWFPWSRPKQLLLCLLTVLFWAGYFHYQIKFIAPWIVIPALLGFLIYALKYRPVTSVPVNTSN